MTPEELFRQQIEMARQRHTRQMSNINRNYYLMVIGAIIAGVIFVIAPIMKTRGWF